MSDLAIRVQNLSKRYRIGLKEETHDTFAGMLADYVRRPVHNLRRLRRLTRFDNPSSPVNGQRSVEDDIIWALKDVSFEVRQGEVVGVIGRNGAGKSTLLKVLSRITHPTSGRVELNGRVSSLLEVGTGFHPELTGRENIYLNGTILGMRKQEIDLRFDEIVDFSGIEKFIDTAVKRYSSGMRVRLAFSVAAHLEPEILLIDEVLAVGDIEFQKKCLGKMNDVALGGRTVVFVSHDMAAVQKLCPASFLLSSGQIILAGPTHKAVATYLNESRTLAQIQALKSRSDRRGNGVLRFTDLHLHDKNGCEVAVAQTGEHLTIALDYRMESGSTQPAIVQLLFTNKDGQMLLRCLSRNSHNKVVYLPQTGRILCHFPRLPFLEGHYPVNIWCKVGEELADDIEAAFTLEVVKGDFYNTGRLNSGMKDGLLADHSWEFEKC